MTSKATVSSIVCLVLALFACDAGPAPAPSPEPVAVEEADSPAEAPAPGVPKISAEAVHEFGAIKASDSVEHVFKIRNEGTAELVIEKVHKT